MPSKANIGGNNGLFDMTGFYRGHCCEDSTLSVPFILKGDGIRFLCPQLLAVVFSGVALPSSHHVLHQGSPSLPLPGEEQFLGY